MAGRSCWTDTVEEEVYDRAPLEWQHLVDDGHGKTFGVTVGLHSGAELVRHYKPDREVYQSAADILDLKPAEVMMVAAHSGDLRAAKDVGLRTAFVMRLLEFGPNGKPDLKADSPVDISAKDFNDLASQLGA